MSTQQTQISQQAKIQPQQQTSTSGQSIQQDQLPRFNITQFPLQSLQIYDCTKDNRKIRLGRPNDGGYVILDNFDYDLYLGCGISNDDSFEETFLAKHKKVKAYAFDGTIDSYPPHSYKIDFVKKNIGPSETEFNTNMHDLIDSHNDIFLKMDIEGGEYDWIASLSDKQLKKFRQITMEFHFPFAKERWHSLQRLAHSHYLCHFHGNNFQTCSFYSKNIFNIGSSETNTKTIILEHELGENDKIGTVPTQYDDIFEYKVNHLGKVKKQITVRRVDKDSGWAQDLKGYFGQGVMIPNVFECTYIRKTDLNYTPPLNTEIVPSYMDQRNNPRRDDLLLSGYPYTNW